MGRKRIRRRLNGAARMQSSLCFKIRCMSKLRRVKQSKVGIFTARIADPRLPTLSATADTKETAFVIQSRLALILLIDACRYLSQVGKTVVRPASIDVVDLIFRPFSVDVQPSKAMVQITSTVNLCLQVPVTVRASCHRSSTCSASGRKPSENASLRIVGKKLAQALLSDHVAPHQSGKPSKDAASGDESPVPRRVSCRTILPAVVANPRDCGKIKALSRPGHQQLVPSWRVAYA